MKSGGTRKGTRHSMRKRKRQRGKLSLVRYLGKFKEGDRVYLRNEPSMHSGLCFRRFCGKVGEVVGKRGRCYEVKIKNGKVKKILIVHPVHLAKAG